MPQNLTKKVVARNRYASFSYDFSDYLNAGIVLRGYEVKSARHGTVNLRNSFVRVEHGEVWLIDAHIPKWRFANIKDYDPKVERKLLLTKNEIKKLVVAQDAKKMSLIPLEMFVERNRLKLKIGIGKGRKKYDKRKKIKEREQKREIDRELARAKTY